MNKNAIIGEIVNSIVTDYEGLTITVDRRKGTTVTVDNANKLDGVKAAEIIQRLIIELAEAKYDKEIAEEKLAEIQK